MAFDLSAIQLMSDPLPDSGSRHPQTDAITAVIGAVALILADKDLVTEESITEIFDLADDIAETVKPIYGEFHIRAMKASIAGGKQLCLALLSTRVP